MFLLNSPDLVRRMALTALKLRYRNSVLGFLWSILNPLFMIIVLSVVFGYFFPDRFDVGVPYPVFLVIGLILWRFFTHGTNMGLRALSDSSHIIRKVSFSREALPLASVLTALITTILEFAVFFLLIIIFSFFFDIDIGPTVMIFPYFLALEFLFVLGLSLCLSAAHVIFRDMAHIWEVVVFGGFFATPIFYPMHIIPYRYERFLHLNPLSDIITGSRAVLIYGDVPGIKVFVYPLAASLFTLLMGIIVFTACQRRIEKEV